MERYVCLYTVEYIYDNKSTIRTDYGMLTVTDFIDAMQQIVNIYGNDLCRVKEIELHDTIATFSEDLYKAIKKELS